MESFEICLHKINSIVWGAPALILILGVGIYLSLKTNFVQIYLLPRAMRNFIQKFHTSKHESGVSSYRSLCTALSATVGTGNIAGVAGAIAIGGPGAVFWMWVCAIFGMVIKLAEAAFAVRYQKRTPEGEVLGGPMYIIESGLGKGFRWLASLYAFFGVAAALGVGNATQVNAVLDGLNSAFGCIGVQESKGLNLLIAFILALVTACCLVGGAGRIGKVSEKLIPIAACGYIGLGAVVLIISRRQIPRAFHEIFLGAFSPGAVTGGMIGSFFVALRTGVSRGVFTNEAGMGTAAISYASSTVEHPIEQGLMGIVEVFIDTILICTVTALVILCSADLVIYGTDEGAALTSRAFCTVLGDWVSVPIAIFLASFAFATMLGWGLYGARCTQYLFGKSAWKIFVLIQVAVVTLSAVLETGIVWITAEIMNGLMAIPNLLALAMLSPDLFEMIGDYFKKNCARCLGGTYESFNQCKPLRAFSYAKVSSSGGGSGEKG